MPLGSRAPGAAEARNLEMVVKDAARPRSRDPNRIPELEDEIRSLRRYARALVGDPFEADDLVQEACGRVLARAGHRHIRNYRRYAYRVLRNLVRDHLRRSRSGISTIPFDEEVGSAVDSPPRQPARMEVRELGEALESLPMTQREVMLLVGLEGMSYEAAAEILGLPIGTVMSRLSRGRSALKRRLGKPAG